MDVAEILSKAADLIEPEGAWTQGRWGDPRSCMCAEMAIYQAAKGVGARDTLHAVRQFGQFLTTDPRCGEWRLAVVDWNDAPERTQAEVVAKLREAAALSKVHNEGGEG